MAQKTLELESLADSLGKLCVRWVEDTHGTLVDDDVLLFRSLTNELKGISNTIQGTSAYLNAFATESTSNVHFLPNNAELNNLLLDWLIRVNEDQKILHSFLSVADALKKAVNLLCIDTLSPRVKINRSAAFGFRPLLVATALVNESASQARTAVDQIQSFSSDWQRLDESIGSIDSTGIQAAEIKQEKNAGNDENHYGIDKIFKVISDWAQENLVKAIYQFDDGIEDFKFGRVSQISKFWKEHGLWQVEGLVEYTIGGAQKISRNVSFQVDDNFSVLGWNLYESVRV